METALSVYDISVGTVHHSVTVHHACVTFHYVVYISIIKRSRLGFTSLQTQKETKSCLHEHNTKQITIITLFKELATVAANASLRLQKCGSKPDSFYDGKVHYKLEGVM